MCKYFLKVLTFSEFYFFIIKYIKKCFCFRDNNNNKGFKTIPTFDIQRQQQQHNQIMMPINQQQRYGNVHYGYHSQRHRNYVDTYDYCPKGFLESRLKNIKLPPLSNYLLNSKQNK